MHTEKRQGNGPRILSPADQLLFVLIALLCWYSTRSGHIRAWQLSELAINYEAGFVRRGLLGELAFFTARHFGVGIESLFVNLFLVLSLTQAALFIALCSRIRPLALKLAIVFSPILLLFPVYDSGASWRKDIFVAILLLVHAHGAHRARAAGDLPRHRRLVFLFLAPALTLGVLIHENQIFFLPAHLLIFACTHWRLGQRMAPRHGLVLLLMPLMAAGFAAHHHGTAEQVRLICASWASIGQRVDCGGGMGALAWSLGKASSYSGILFRDPRSLLTYELLVVLSLLPLAVLWSATSRDAAVPAPRSASPLVLAGILPPSVLFFLGWDWGRWLHLMMVALLCALAAYRGSLASGELPARRHGLLQRLGLGLLAFAYISSWSVPHCGRVHGTSGKFIPLLLSVLRHMVSQRGAP